jgi:ABC-type Fe3+ transport system permease subunit
MNAKTFFLLCSIMASSCEAKKIQKQSIKPKKAAKQVDLPWYRDYKKAAWTGAVIGCISPFITPLGYGAVMTATGESTFSEVIEKFTPHLKKSMVVSPISALLSACVITSIVKTRDALKRKKKKKEAL